MFVGALLSSTAPDRYIRPVITFVIFASGLKYVGLGTSELGWALVDHAGSRVRRVGRTTPPLAAARRRGPSRPTRNAARSPPGHGPQAARARATDTLAVTVTPNRSDA